ncbi:MAG: transposase, partial [Candidatus Altiarchaeales archaeon]|nr:transposase [Candidatus Altiarchaeales archaeon]
MTRILVTDTPTDLHRICKVTGFLRADIWRRYGALGTVGKNADKIRKEITARKLYKGLDVDGTIRAETTKDIVNDILTYKAAAKEKVKKAIARKPKGERKLLYTFLKSDRWLEDSFLHRQMRKHFRHGVSHTDNQFIARSDKVRVGFVNGFLTVTIKIARKYGKNITLTTTSNGKNVNLIGSNLRIIVKETHTEIHYSIDKEESRSCGDQEIGVDKGYSEAFVDSDGYHHGTRFGAVMSEYTDKVCKTGKARNKLHALEKKYRKAGKIQKADNIRTHNLGRKKLNSRKNKTQQRLRNIVFKAAHSIVDKAETVASEDLTSPIANKQPWKKFNRRMSGWAKGVLAEALDSVCTQRGASHVLVNCAYTSQMDSLTGSRPTTMLRGMCWP